MPPQLHDPIRQDAVLLTRGRGRQGPTALLEYLRGEKATSIIKSFGYER
ncbi:MAG: molybdate ABC transporter, periplasmic molybdate-binding protein [Candidatus Accumulibacter sp. BA-94]|nr:MAG: molybdate ABC transporter, periplasmic molybdate-binding protein [Candidatus Accumulibacter sp. BA-94]